MKHLFSVLIATVLSVIFVGCSSSSSSPQYDSRLTDIYAMLGKYEYTDSAFRLLSEMNVSDFSAECDRAYYAYLYTVVLYWLNAHAQDDSLIKVATDYYALNGDSAMRAKVFMYAAMVYESIGERETSVQCYNRALESTPVDSLNLKSHIYTYWAEMINRDNPDDDALALFDKAKEYASMSGNIYSVANAYLQQGSNHMFNQKIDDAILCYKQTVRLMENREWNHTMMFSALNKLAFCYAHKHLNDSALYYAGEAAKYVKSLTNRRYINATLCRIYTNLNQWDKAEACLALADDTLAYQGKAFYLDNAIKIERGRGNYRKASDLAVRYSVCTDSLYIRKLRDNAAMYQKKYDKTAVELERAELAMSNKQLQTSILLIIIAVIIIAAIVVAVIYRRRYTVAQREKAREEAMDALTCELQSKIIELQNLRLQLAESESLALDSQQEVTGLKEQIFEMNSVVQKIKALKKTKTADLHDKKSILHAHELEVLMQALDSCYNGVITRIRQLVPNISKDELNLCCLICLDVSLAKSSLLLGISEETLRQRKYRLRHSKMNLPENITLDLFINNLKSPQKH